MSPLARAATAALLALIAPRLETQSGTVHFTLGGGAHAGSYALKAALCNALGPREGPRGVISEFTPDGGEERPGAPGSKSPTRFELYSQPVPGKPDALAVDVELPGPAACIRFPHRPDVRLNG